MKKHLLFALFLTCSIPSFTQLDVPAVHEYSLTKSGFNFGDTYIETEKTDSLYIIASEENTGTISLKIIFDEDRNSSCPIINGPPSMFFTKNIFEVFVDDFKLNSTPEIIFFPISDIDMGNITIDLAPGDSAQVKVRATPANHRDVIIDNPLGDPFIDCRFGINSSSSLGLQSDIFTVTNLSTAARIPVDSSFTMTFTGTDDPNNITGLFDFNSHVETVKIFPNPATSIINTEEGKLEILDLTGNLVLSTIIK